MKGKVGGEKREPEGVLRVIKPSGMTAHDVVTFVRRVLKIRRVGHTGTLDPLATGLMLLCLGRATRLAEFLSGLDKVYRFEIVFGVRTSTQDAEGEILSVMPTEDVTEAKVKEVLRQFVGEIKQYPPMLSALHYRGTRLYRLARKGIEVPRQPRRVHIYRLTLLRFWGEKAPKRGLMEVHCSPGTYIRVLCADIGEALRCGAYQHFLVRTTIGPFSLEGAVTLEEFAEAVRKNALKSLLLPMDQALPMFPSISLRRLDIRKILNGMEVIIGTVWGYPKLREGERVRVYDPDGQFWGVGEVFRRGNILFCRPRKVFPPDNLPSGSGKIAT